MSLLKYFKSNDRNADFSGLILEVDALIAAESLDGGEIDTLEAAWRIGIMDSGDTPSKSGRLSLLQKGVLCQTCYADNHYGFSISYPFGYKVYNALKAVQYIRRSYHEKIKLAQHD